MKINSKKIILRRITNYEEELENLATNYKKFILSFEQLIFIKKIQNFEFLVLKDNLVYDLLLYYTEIVPMTKKIILKINECYNFNNMDIEDYLNNIHKINKKFNETDKQLNFLSKIYGAMISNTKAQQIKVKILIKDLKNEEDQLNKNINDYEKKINKLEDQKNNVNKPSLLVTIPIFNIFYSKIKNDKLKSIECNKRTEINKLLVTRMEIGDLLKTIMIINNTIYPAINAYLNSFCRLKEIFLYMSSDARSILSSHNRLENTQKIGFYNMVKKLAKVIENSTDKLLNIYEYHGEKIENSFIKIGVEDLKNHLYVVDCRIDDSILMIIKVYKKNSSLKKSMLERDLSIIIYDKNNIDIYLCLKE